MFYVLMYHDSYDVAAVFKAEDAVVARIHAGEMPMPIKFEAEPRNAYDDGALKVMVDGSFLGYMPKSINRDLSVLRFGSSAELRGARVDVS